MPQLIEHIIESLGQRPDSLADYVEQTSLPRYLDEVDKLDDAQYLSWRVTAS